jgi:hypothetical protein
MPMESLRRRGKLFIAELDPSTYRDAVAHQVIGGHGGLGSGSVEGSLRILRRDLGGVLANGIAGWFLDFGPLNNAPEGWYSGEPIIAEIKKFIDIGTRRRDLDLRSVGEFCTVYDQQSFTATAHWMAGEPWTNYGIKSTDYFNHWFLNTQARALYRVGAPMDSLFRFDLTAADARRYKLFLMVNAYYLSDQEADLLRKAFRDSGTTVVWYYAPGFINTHQLDRPQMEKLTGFRFDVLETPGPMMIHSTIRSGEAKIEKSFGVSEDHFPRFVVKDRDVELLGEWTDGVGPAFAVREYEGHTSVYVGSAPVPAEILRLLAQRAGVTMWSSRNDIVYATEDAAMIVATDAGKRTFTLPKPMASMEGGEAALMHSLDMELGDVGLFLSPPVK